ncbi:AAA family ATPase [Ramlibacter sp. WS9]|uniref:AAA family ATPase n=1 Tax=Ramlibacter sp. WS9 TaxID=1882741 RepID=UPI0018EE4809|nr:AAA family ATPase [Ramlibacter sp. WS9]
MKFFEKEIALLSAINGRGKTTLMSYIVDAFYEMTKNYYTDVASDSKAYFRLSSPLDAVDRSKPSIVYMRFMEGADVIDFSDVRGPCTEAEYAAAVALEEVIPYEEHLANSVKQLGAAKAISPKLTRERAHEIFGKNVTAYFPPYRFEVPSYLRYTHQQEPQFTKQSPYSGRLGRPLESTGCLPLLTNWLMDVTLDLQYTQTGNAATFGNINKILCEILEPKLNRPVRLGVGQRNMGATRLQIVTDEPDPTMLYPNLFRLSSGEAALLCLFGEICRIADLNATNIKLEEITGIVLVDEIDKHLHIKLQKEALPRLLELFPKIQFLVSSHSPFLHMGLAETCSERTRAIDIQTGLAITPMTDPQLVEVYELMIHQNERFREMYEGLLAKLTSTGLQIVTEGKNTEHLRKALSILAPDLIDKVGVISGAEDRTGSQQLKNAFEVMRSGSHAGSFLFVWDCDAADLVSAIAETDAFHTYALPVWGGNGLAKKGIENLYDPGLFTDDVYETRTIDIEYGGTKTERIFNKKKFLDKILALNDAASFANYSGFVNKVRALVA